MCVDNVEIGPEIDCFVMTMTPDQTSGALQELGPYANMTKKMVNCFWIL